MSGTENHGGGGLANGGYGRLRRLGLIWQNGKTTRTTRAADNITAIVNSTVRAVVSTIQAITAPTSPPPLPPSSFVQDHPFIFALFVFCCLLVVILVGLLV
ncbi:hypothetical protein RvY_13450 [Ramazzottius varieornatus]|uniref:Uncharacterized protein n=1 Tax=Ramazzottius varieornatus TaxID=947166 RepID=A0A1D1VWF7_RAMVA|nr:hypothetical protein RvY_13450 [Ramazzottius varieornatus]